MLLGTCRIKADLPVLNQIKLILKWLSKCTKRHDKEQSGCDDAIEARLSSSRKENSSKNKQGELEKMDGQRLDSLLCRAGLANSTYYSPT